MNVSGAVDSVTSQNEPRSNGSAIELITFVDTKKITISFSEIP